MMEGSSIARGDALLLSAPAPGDTDDPTQYVNREADEAHYSMLVRQGQRAEAAALVAAGRQGLSALENLTRRGLVPTDWSRDFRGVSFRA